MATSKTCDIHGWISILCKRTVSSEMCSTTVKPVLSDHPTVQGKMVVIDRWSLKQGFPETDRFFEALLNSCERCGTHTFDLRNDIKIFTSIWCKRWPHAVVFSQTCAVVTVSTVNMGTKQRFSLLLVAKGRENPVVGAKNVGRWSR